MSTTLILYIVLALLGSYLIGCLQPSYLLGKAIKHVDIRDYGSGNSGATNAIRVFGFKFGMVCLLIDAAKGALAVLLVKLFLGPDVVGSEGAAILLQLCCGLCVILGHNYPFYMHFRGGKGVAASIGILLMVDWRLILIAGIPALLVMVLSRIRRPGHPLLPHGLLLRHSAGGVLLPRHVVLAPPLEPRADRPRRRVPPLGQGQQEHRRDPGRPV